MLIYLKTYGTKLRVKNSLFQVSYYDENKHLKRTKFSPEKVKSIWAEQGTSLSIDAIHLAIAHDIDIVILDKLGRPTGRFLSLYPSTTTYIQKVQVQLSTDLVAFDFVIEWINKKIDNQILFLEELGKRRKGHYAQKLSAHVKEMIPIKTQLSELPPGLVKDRANSIHGLEGLASRIYFQGLSEVLPSRYKFNGRSRRPPKDIFNAFLSYGYAILYSVIERSLIKVGLNPFIGFFHRDGHQLRSMVFDFIEPFRIYVDRMVFRLFSQKKVFASHIQAIEGGVYLNYKGKELLLNAFQKYFHRKKWLLNREQRKLVAIIELQARNFVKKMLIFYENKSLSV